MRCPACSTKVLPGKPFCHACGTRLPESCPDCGAATSPEFRFCPECGRPLDPARGADRPGADPTHPTAPLPAPLPEAGGVAPPTRPAATSERKRVTVLFCDLAGSTAIAESMDPEDYRELLDRYLQLALAEVQRHEGLVNQLAGDGFMALFGAPVAREDAPELAVDAALAILNALDGSNRAVDADGAVELRARIGVHTGPVVVGNVGNDLKTDYTAIGDTTNLAARLQAHARPGSVLISEATQRLVEGQFVVRPAGPFDVKGRREPVPAFEVEGASGATSPMAIAEARGLTPFVGREAELAQIEAGFAQLAHRLPQVVSVVGEAGSGKSRLVHELKQRVQARGAAVFEGRGSSFGRDIPFAPFVGLLESFFEIQRKDPPETRRQKIRSTLLGLDPPLPELEARLNRALAGEPHESGSGAEKARETLEAADRLIDGVCRTRPVVIIVEDLHWIDESSREMLAEVVGSMEDWQVLLLVTHRPEFVTDWRTPAVHTRIRLRPLAPDDALRIVRARAGGPLPAELERRITQRAEGNPFFLEEITRGLLEQGVIVAESEGPRLARPVNEVTIPDTVQEMIDARLDRLAPTAKRTAQVGAVFGRQFRGDELAAALEGEHVDVPRELEELERRGILHRVGAPQAGGEYRFGESLTQSVAYESLLVRERRQLHERIADLLASGDGGPEREGLRARHLARGTDRARGVESLLGAARDAEALPSYGSASQLYHEAWDLAEQVLASDEADPAKARQWVLEATHGIARVTVLYGSPEGSEEERAVARGLELAAELDDPEALVRLLGLGGMIAASIDRDRFGEAVEMTERGLAIAREAGLETSARALERTLGWLYQMDGRLDEARIAVSRVLAELEAQKPDPLTDLHLSLRGFWIAVLLYAGDLAQAERYAEQTYSAAVRASNRTMQSASASHAARAAFLRGDYESARRWADLALETGRAIGNTASMRSGAILALGARRALGEPRSLQQYAPELGTMLDAAGDFALSTDLLTDILIDVGATDLARRYAKRSLERAGGRLRQMLAWLAMGHVALAERPAEVNAAERAYARARDLALEIETPLWEVTADLGLARVAAARGEPGAADRLAVVGERASALGLHRIAHQAARCTCCPSAEGDGGA